MVVAGVHSALVSASAFEMESAAGVMGSASGMGCDDGGLDYDGEEMRCVVLGRDFDDEMDCDFSVKDCVVSMGYGASMGYGVLNCFGAWTDCGDVTVSFCPCPWNCSVQPKQL
jgi:hypothetical protein